MFTHHAYFLTGDSKKALDFLDKNIDIEKKGNPDYFFIETESLSIDEARNLKNIHSKKPFGEKRILVIQTENIPIESQNALLKLFEEPEPGNTFFIVMEKANILPTLLSRVQVINFKKENKGVDKFLKMQKKERLDFVKDLSKSEGYNLAQGIGNIKKDRKTLEAVVRVKKYINDRGSSTKQLLEYLAVTV